MKRIPFCICLLFYLNIQAQSIYFPNENYQDISTLSNKIPALAKWVADQYQKVVSFEFYSDQIFLRTVAGEYTTALNYLDSFRIMIGNEMNNSAFVKV